MKESLRKAFIAAVVGLASIAWFAFVGAAGAPPLEVHSSTDLHEVAEAVRDLEPAEPCPGKEPMFSSPEVSIDWIRSRVVVSGWTDTATEERIRAGVIWAGRSPDLLLFEQFHYAEYSCAHA
jgi:hypothetical protein